MRNGNDLPGILCASKVPLQRLVVVLGPEDGAACQHIVAAQPAAEVGHQHEAHVSAVIQQLKAAQAMADCSAQSQIAQWQAMIIARDAVQRTTFPVMLC